MRRIRKWIREVREQKHVKFDDLNRIAERCRNRYPKLFPKYSLNKDGSSFVHHFNVNGVAPISLEKEHGSREFVPPRYAKLALLNLEALADYIEHMTPEDQDERSEDDKNEA